MMPSPHSELAHRLAGMFAELPQVEAIALGGSHSSQVSDARSDIDLYVYTHSDIPLTVRQAIVDRAGGATKADLGLTHWGPGDEWFDAATGIEVDIIYFNARWMENQIQRVWREHQASLGYTTCFCYTIRHSQIFFDPRGWFAGLQSLCQQQYPEPLRRNIIAFNHPILRAVIPSYFNQLQKAVKRGDMISINHRLAGLLTSYFDVIFALNRQLHPGEKRLVELALARCDKLPLNMASDLTDILRMSAAGDQSFLVKLAELLDHLDQLLEQEGFDHQTSLPKITAMIDLPSDLNELTELDFSGKQLSSLPAMISDLTNLQKLWLDKNQLTDLPTSLENLANLKILHVDQNKLTALLASIGRLTQLETLSLYSNQLTALPDSVWQLTNLQTLNLAENHFSALSEGLGNLANLRMLDLGHNALAFLPESLGNLNHLAFLYLSYNQLTSLPQSFANLKNLIYLNITDNQLASLPESIGNLASLIELRLYNNHFSSLPESLGHLTNLKELHLWNNELISLPEPIGNLAHLKKLILQNNKLASLPESIGNLTSLTELDLRNNKLASLPNSLGNLKNLAYLDLRANKLTTLPASLGELTRLEKLDLRWNRLSALPKWIQRLEERGCTVFI